MTKSFFIKLFLISFFTSAFCMDISFAQKRFMEDEYYKDVIQKFDNSDNKDKFIKAVCDTSIVYAVGHEKYKRLLLHFYQYLDANHKPIPYKLDLALGMYYAYSKNEGVILAMDYILKALQQSDIFKDSSDFTTAYLYLGNLFYKINDFAEAEKYLTEAEKKIVLTKLSYNKQIGIYNTLGLIFLKTNQYQKAVSYFEKTIATATIQHDTIWIGLAKGNLGTTYYRAKKYKEAQLLLEEDIKISTQFKLYDNVVLSLCDMIGICIDTKDLKNAKIYLEEALSLLKDMKKEVVELPSYYNIYDIASVYYETQKDYEKAFYYKKEAQVAQKEYQDFLKNEDLQKIKFRYQEEKNLLEIGRLTKQRETQKVYLYLAIAISFFMILLAILIYQRYKEKQKSNQLLLQQNQMLQAQKEHIDLQNKDLHNLNQTKNRLFSLIGHDLRTPLVSLKGIVDLLKNGDMSIDELKGIIPFLNNSLESTLNLTDDLLHWGRMQLDGMKANLQEINVQDFMLANTSRLTMLAKIKKISIEVEVSQQIKKGYADENMLKAVIRNLMSNAIKFCNPHGKITISAHNDTDEHFVIFAVSDTGIGISPENIDKLFSDTAFTTQGTQGEKGTGFGLTFCKDFVHLNGGKIWVESELGKGSTFYFTIPTPMPMSPQTT